jgi:hypothetical protein
MREYEGTADGRESLESILREIEIGYDVMAEKMRKGV